MSGGALQAGVPAAVLAPAPTPAVWTARVGLITAAAVVLAVLAAVALGLGEPWWAAITAWRVADAEPRATLTRSAQRVAGTVLGAAAAVAAASLAGEVAALQAILLFGAAAGVTWLRFTSARLSYFWTLGGITAVLVLVQACSAPHALYAFVVARVLEITCGVVVGAAAVLLLSGRAPAAPPAVAAAPDAAGVARVALLAGTAMLLVVLLWDMFDLPAMVQTAISVLVVLDRDMIRLRQRGGQRFTGCLAGGGLGVLLLGIGLDGFLPWAAALGGGVYLFSRLALSPGPASYFGVQGGMALITALVVGPGPPDALVPVLNRLAGTVLGVSLLVGLAWVLAPPRAPPPPP